MMVNRHFKYLILLISICAYKVLFDPPQLINNKIVGEKIMERRELRYLHVG